MSTAPCPNDPPFYYLAIAHLIASISIPINLFAIYLVLCRSPGMSRYKYHVFYLQLVLVLTELKITVISPGFFFFPLLGGYNLNSFFGKLRRSHLSTVDFAFLLASELPAAFWCFVYRHNAAVEMVYNKKIKKPLKTLALFIVLIFPFSIAFGLYMSELTREETYQFLKQNYPQCIHWAENELFTVYDYHINPWVAVTGIVAFVTVIFFSSCAFGLGFHTMLLLHRLRPHMSVQTFRIHQAALISLSLQVVIPAVLMIIPLVVIYLVVFFDLIEYQQTATNMLLVMSGHSLCSSIVMIGTNSRHRAYIKSIFKTNGRKRKNGHSAEPSTVIQVAAHH